MEVILGIGGNFENLDDIAFNCKFQFYTNISNKVHPNKMVKIPTTIQNHVQRTSIDED